MWYEHVDYVKADIDDIVYAEPTQAAKDFDLEGYIKSLPPIEYEKINYPVKETYTYNFNKYTITVDIPEGYTTKILPLKEKPKVVDSEGLSDSCWILSNDSKLCALEPGYNNSDEQSGVRAMFWKGEQVRIHSDNKLCIFKPKQQFKGTKFESKVYNKECLGLLFVPVKSGYKGVSLRNIVITHYNTNKKNKILKEGMTLDNNLLSVVDRYPYISYAILISDNQSMQIGALPYLMTENYNIYNSIINSIKITPK